MLKYHHLFYSFLVLTWVAMPTCITLPCNFRSSKVVWGLEMGHSVLGNFSDLVFVHSDADLTDGLLGHIVGNATAHDILRSSYVQNAFGAMPPLQYSK